MPRPRIAITAGEPAGIGAEIISMIDPSEFDAELVVIGDRDLLETRARNIGSSLEFSEYQAGEASNSAKASISILHQSLITPSQAGKLDSKNSKYVLNILDRAYQGCLDGEFDAMVTAPLHKEVINRSGFSFTGHTEYLANGCNVDTVVMLLHAKQLRVALVTTHLALRDVADAINDQLIGEIANILNNDLVLKFGLKNPHIKVCGLNPHAGENGCLGREEIEIIIPCIKKLQASGMNISGPYPADTLFTPKGLIGADAVLAMYHDQGLPVLKYAGFHQAVNSTLGLPIVRTSVDHGTALDLAGTSKADAGSLFCALHSAISQADYMANFMANSNTNSRVENASAT